MDMGDNAYNTK